MIYNSLESGYPGPVPSPSYSSKGLVLHFQVDIVIKRI